MTTALILFAIAAVGGLVLATIRFRGKPYPPLGLALIHGGAAAAALIALVVAVSQATSPPNAVTTALILFLVAAVAGFVLFSNHLRKIALPQGLIVAHALVAVAAFLILLMAVV
jgi:hypothetical protein